jgi:hypothetical protein
VAYAQPTPPKSDADKAEAQRLTDLGTQARARGEAAAALAYFEEAYLILPSPRLHFEIGLAQAAMGRDLAALLALEAFLKDSAEQSPGAIEQAKAEIARLERRIGVVELRATPADARLILDGEAVSSERRIRVAPGAHRFTAEREGYLKIELPLQVAPGESVRPIVALSKSTPAPAVRPKRTWWIWTIAGVLAAGLVATAVVLSVPTTTVHGPCDTTTPGLGCVKFGGAP